MTRWKSVVVYGCVSLAAALVLVACMATPAQHARKLSQHGAQGALASRGPVPGSPGDIPGARVLEWRRHDPQDVDKAVAWVLPGEELWVIERSPTSELEAAQPSAPQPAVEIDPGSGELRARIDGREIPLPLKHTDVQAAIAGYIATVDVTQQYHNPYDEKIEAVYVFPLPQDAAVSAFVMTVGERRIRGIIREREEAEEIYIQARAQGFVASLLTQERPNIFTQSVANIEPGKQIDIQIRYFNTLAYADGWYEFVFPMVVGPRFNPPGTTDGVGAISRGAPGRSGQQTEVQYLRPDERSGHDIALTLDLHAGVPIEELVCRSHAVDLARPSPDRATVTLSPLDAVPNRDFVLRYKVAGDRIKTALMTHEDERGGFFTLMLYPPEDLRSLDRAPVEMIFVLDCSGSMSGEPIAQAKSAIQWALGAMRPDDTFQIVRFSDNASRFGSRPVLATPENVRKARAYVSRLSGHGGTMMIEGIRAALDFPHDPERLRTVAFLTDGYIGNEAEVLAEVARRIGSSRIFSFGVGSSVNRYLLERMARLGRGTVAYLGLHDSGAEVMQAYFERTSHPALTDLAIDFGPMRVAEVFPQRLPDLFVGRPVILTGRYEGALPTRIVVHGRAGGEPRQVTVDLRGVDTTAPHAGLPAVWARLKIADLTDRMMHDADPELPELIQETALVYGLMSAYTAFVAVDSMTQTAGDHGTAVVQPVPVPVGVRYETTVTDHGDAGGVEGS